MYHDYSMNKILSDLRSPEKKYFILDTDTDNEVDDQFAIAYAMLSDKVDLLGLCAAPYVNDRAPDPATGAENSYLEMVKVRDMIDPEKKVPCYRGSPRYMTSMDEPVASEAAENIARIVRETDGIVYTAVIGCFTNLASALLIDPSIKDKMVVLMIGANAFDHNGGDCNEFNLYQDRMAAKVIFECGVPVVVLPAMGGTEKIYTTSADLQVYLKDQAGEIGNYLCRLVERDEGPLFNADGSANCRYRIIWDIGSVAVLKMGDGAADLGIVPARTIDMDGFWKMREDLGRRMIMASNFRRNVIMSDFYTVLRNAYKD